MVKFIKNIFFGFALGTAEIIPGVSGGTIALILGCYDEMLESVNHFKSQCRKSLLFLLPLLIGMAVALVLLSSLVGYLLENFSLPTMLFFIGLIAGIIPVLYNKVTLPEHRFRISLKNAALTLLPVALLVAMSALELRVVINAENENVIANIQFPLMLVIFFAGVLASCALVVPGVSGSFVLLTIGLYPVVIQSVSSVSTLLKDFSNTALLFDILKVLLPFGLGVVIGALSMMRLMEFLLKNYRTRVYAVILGLLTGSLYVLFTDPTLTQSGITAPAVAVGAATFLSGAALSFLLGKRKL